MVTIASFTFNGFQENTYVLAAENDECWIIDPGCYTPGEQQTLRQYIATRGWQPAKLINTHGHLDHIFGNAFVQETWGLPLHAHPGDAPVIAAAPQIAQAYGIPMTPSPPIAHALQPDTVLRLGTTEVQILFVPGHSPGHIALYAPEEEWLVSGDVLFQGSIGRTDLPGGDYSTLMASIDRQLMPLPDAVKVYSGHGPTTTIGTERRTNPFILSYREGSGL